MTTIKTNADEEAATRDISALLQTSGKIIMPPVPDAQATEETIVFEEGSTSHRDVVSALDDVEAPPVTAPTTIGESVPTIDTSAMEVVENGVDPNKPPGYFLRWSRLYKKVEVKDQSAGGLMGNASISVRDMSKSEMTLGAHTKVILSEVSACAAPGEVLACMGPSGSGKTSLMNVLSGRSAYQDGVISINGDPLKSSTMKRLMSRVAYVKQQDVFFEHLTVRDQLTYTALLRLPSSKSTEQKHAEVERLIRLLRLSKVGDSPICMVSGGEKKRVNIGTELLTDPLVVLLDEPTSGLDSTSAVSLLNLLQNLARDENKTIITSIHQPSSAVFMNFDKLLMLSEGQVVYFGKPNASLQYLRDQSMPCPPGYNAADHWMDLLVVDAAVEEERLEEEERQERAEEQASESNGAGPGTLRRRRGEEAKRKGSPRMLLQNAWDNEAVAEQMDQALVAVADDDSSTGLAELEGRSKYPTTWGRQFAILMHRALKNSRSAIFTWLNLIKSIAIGIVTGLLWFQKPYTEQNINDIRSYYFFTMTFWVFDSMFTALTAFPSERTVILKERASGSYRLSAYFMAKTASDAPVRLILPFLYMVVSYWMGGFDNRFVVFIGTIGCTLLSVVSGEALGLMIGAIVYDLETAITVMAVFTLALMLLGGFFVENIPNFIAWGKYLSPFKYAFDSSLQIIFDRPVPCDGSGVLENLCSGGAEYASSQDVLDHFGVQGSIGFNIGLLLLICFIPRYIAYLGLRMKKGGERS